MKGQRRNNNYILWDSSLICSIPDLQKYFLSWQYPNVATLIQNSRKYLIFFLDKTAFWAIIVRKMNNSLQDYLFKPSERMRDLQLLEEIEQNPRVSQRELSNKFGIALGVTNACIKRMARRGSSG